VFLAVQILIPLFPMTITNFVVFFMLLNRKFNENFKNVFKTVIFLVQESFTGDLVSDCPFKLCFWQFKFWHRFSP